MAARLLKTVSSPPPERTDVVSGGSSTSVQPRGGAVTNRGSATTGRTSGHILVMTASLQLTPAVHASICVGKIERRPRTLCQSIVMAGHSLCISIHACTVATPQRLQACNQLLAKLELAKN